MRDGGFRRLRVYQMAHDLGVRIHAMSLRLPKFERDPFTVSEEEAE